MFLINTKGSKMSNYQTIQKLAETTGTSEASIRKMINCNILTKFKIPGFKRIYVDIQEFDSKIQQEKNISQNISIDMDHFLIS